MSSFPLPMRLALRLLLSLTVAVVAAEGLALALHYAESGWLFYLNPHRPPHPGPAGDARQAFTGDALQPYFGPTHTPGIAFDIPAELRAAGAPVTSGLRTNNYGFVATGDYPVPRSTDRQFLVGILGGSVANWFCHVGTPRLVERLRDHPSLADRDIVPVCLAHEGYKQPQQLLVLAYFLSIGQAFDLVLNIDGFNEVALGAMNDQRGYDASMPSVAHMDPMVNLVDRGTLTPEKTAALVAIGEGRQAVARWGRRADAARAAFVYLVADRLYQVARQRQQAAVRHFDALPSVGADTSLIRMVPKRAALAGDALFRQIAREWADASGQMQALLTARGIPYLHVLQPNQYASTRPFTDAERAVAFIAGSPFRPGAEQGYPHLLADPAQQRLRDAGVRFVDATHAFDRTPEPVFWDNCCHYTRRGNEVLAEIIASALAQPGVLPPR